MFCAMLDFPELDVPFRIIATSLLIFIHGPFSYLIWCAARLADFTIYTIFNWRRQDAFLQEYNQS